MSAREIKPGIVVYTSTDLEQGGIVKKEIWWSQDAVRSLATGMLLFALFAGMGLGAIATLLVLQPWR